MSAEKQVLTTQAERLVRHIKAGSALARPESWVAEVEARAIAAFLSHLSADYRKHTAVAVREDMIVACARFGVDPAWFYTDADQLVDADGARSLRADVAHYRIMEGLE